MLLILLTTLLSFVAIWSSFSYIQEKEREYYISLLLLEVSVIGIFASLDLMLMYVFLGFMMIPMYILIVIWGSGNKEYVAFKFFIYTAFGSFINFIGILALAFYHKEVNGFITFDIDKLYGLSLPIIFERWIFLAFFLGFGIKAAIFPLHTWLPDVHTEAPTAGSVMLAGVLLKVGTYGFFRFVMPLFPNATKFFAPYIIILAIISIIYGALVSLVQTDVKKLIAYSSISHLGFIMLGLFSLNPYGVSGAILQMINHGLYSGSLFMLFGMIYERTHTRKIEDYGGISAVMPIYAVFFLISSLASLGLPGLNGFVGEFLILNGSFSSPYIPTYIVVIATIGVIFSASYLLWLYKRMFFGNYKKSLGSLWDINKREFITASILVIFMFSLGLYPKPYLSKIKEPTINFIYTIDKKLGEYTKAELRK
jgi:NADH-quinone oxidoreductase subunit M